MKRVRLALVGLCLGAAPIVAPLAAQYKAPKQQKVEGLVAGFDKASSTITIQEKNLRTRVSCDSRTHITFRNTTATVNEVKEGLRIVCMVRSNDRNQMLATRIDLREK